MCVIVIAEDQRPHRKMLEDAWWENQDGVGLAYREDAADGSGPEVVWNKGLMTRDAALEAIEKAPLPFIAHFRKTSIGGTRPEFCHPFEISENTSLDLEGRTKNWVLFHNGTYNDWHTTALTAALHSNVPIPVGKWMDSRALAWLCFVYGQGFMEFLPGQRGIAFGPDDYNIFIGPGWARVKDQNGNMFWCSNDKPWKNNNGQPLGPMCHATYCRRRDVDSKGYCPEHPNGQVSTHPSTTGGSSVPAAPFQAPGSLPVRLIPIIIAEKLQQDKKISKNMMKGIKDLYWRIGQDGKSPKLTRRAERAKKSLAEISESIRWIGYAD